MQQQTQRRNRKLGNVTAWQQSQNQDRITLELKTWVLIERDQLVAERLQCTSVSETTENGEPEDCFQPKGYTSIYNYIQHSYDAVFNAL